MSGLKYDKLRILVVEDNQHMRKLVVAILHAFGVRDIFESPDGEHAWRTLQDTSPDIILLDWQLPGMTGLDFAHLVRTSPKSFNTFVPIIMLTGHTHIDHVRQARDVGVNEFLAKPVTAKGVLTRLIAVIERPRPFVRTLTYFGPCRRRGALVAYRGPERRTSEELTPVD